MAKKTITSFLIALSESRKMRDRYRDANKRRELLEDWGLSDDPKFQANATVDDFRRTVTEESGLKQVEWWILVDQEPIPNDDYDPSV